MPLEAVDRKEPLSERAYQILKNAILAGDLPPGEPLAEEGLAGRLKISRTPIRTALHRRGRLRQGNRCAGGWRPGRAAGRRGPLGA